MEGEPAIEIDIHGIPLPDTQAADGQLARAEHGRQQVDCHGLEDRLGEEEHHHRAVPREGLVIDIH